MNSIDDLIPLYADMENQIRRLMTRLFGSTCALCTACCCRSDICEEVAESAFLSRMLDLQGRRPDEIDARYGWLGLHGCILDSGRPPVCYSYFCDELLARLPDDETRRIVSVLGKLLYHVGMNAHNGIHLTELRNDSVLAEVDIEEVSRRFSQARAALQVIDAFIRCGRLEQADRKILSLITSDDL
jgi:hypothetical protein